MIVMASSHQLLLVRSLLTLACAGVVSCTTDYYAGPDGNIFMRERRPPRYGHGGTNNPETGDMGQAQPGMRTPHADAQADVGARKPGGTRYLDDSGDSSDTDRSRPGSEPSQAHDDTADNKPKPSSDESKPKSSDDGNLPFGVPVPGKEGLVYSPYYSGGYVDVKGMPPGSKARCPYTKKIFRVP
jgi:hypothetical protein